MVVKCLDTYALMEIYNGNSKFLHYLGSNSVILGETFAEIFKTIYCEKNKFKFKPIPLQSRFSRIFKGEKYPPDFETFYKPASILSKHMNKRPLKYRVSFLRALLFQKYDPLKEDIGSSIMNEGKKAIKYAIDRTYT